MNGNMIYALNTLADRSYDAFSLDAFKKAAEVTLLGMGMVFVVLAILWGIVSLFKIFFVKGEKGVKKESAPKTEKATTDINESASTVVTEKDEAELIAILTAAVAAYREAEEGIPPELDSGFRVVSFKRANTSRGWNSDRKF